MANPKKRMGDRFDATLVRDIDPLHWFVPYLYPNRADNEAFVQEEFDLTNLEAFLAKKNEGRTKDKYTIFHAIAAALVKTVTLRPKMNRFIQGRRLYQRDELSLGFVVKKQFKDNGAEGLAFIKFPEDTTIDSLHARIMDEIFECRRDDVQDNSTQGMEMFTHLPRWLMRIVMWGLHRLDFYGRVPYDLIKADPNYASVFLTNLGSIQLNAGYHHLSNWGTTSVFVIIGEKTRKPVFREDGTYELHDILPIGITLDERIADGYYYAKTVRLIKKLIENPELLDLPANEEVEY